MQQILKFKIEIFDVRMRTSISIVDETSLVQNIRINKSTTLDNTATITFAKSKMYKLLAIEEILKLYNYVKIELEVIESNPSNLHPDREGEMRGDLFYFSGFINAITKSSNFSANPTANVTITISDYASLLKTTFYTKNLTFLEILNQAVPEFRLINLTEYLGADSKKLLENFYSPAQLGFIFFAFLFFKFMYKIVYDQDPSGRISEKRTSSPDSQPIFKKFKLYTPFNFDLPSPYEESFLNGQEQTITIYKQLQGVALDLFKYIYPEPIFEFSTYETKDSVILMIRFTPFMKFDRPVLPAQTITFGSGDFGGEYQEKKESTQGSTFHPSSYNVINRYDFGHNRIVAIRELEDISPAEKLKQHLDAPGVELLTSLQKAIGYSKGISIDDLIVNTPESDEMTKLFFDIQELNSDYIEALNMTRAANSVVNVIWTVPTTDTAVLKMSGRELVYAYLEQRLAEVGGADKFGNYIYQQFNDGFNPNPMFLMDYRGVFGQDFVSGDMNYFGFREFEIKWNYLSNIYYATAHILSRIDKKILKEIKEKSFDKTFVQMLDNAINSGSPPSTQSTQKGKTSPRRNTANKIFKDLSTPSKVIESLTAKSSGKTVEKLLTGKSLEQILKENPPQYRQSVRAEFLRKKQAKNKNVQIQAVFSEKDFQDALKRLKINEADLKNATKVSEILLKIKKENDSLVGGFVSKINGVLGEAFRENEHLYDCSISYPLNIAILPGMIVDSKSSSQLGKSPFIRGYVTTVSHMIDFNGASMRSQFNISRAASDDSGVEAKIADFTP